MDTSAAWFRGSERLSVSVQMFRRGLAKHSLVLLALSIHAYAHAHFLTVSSVRVVMSVPKVRSSRVMKTGPLPGT